MDLAEVYSPPRVTAEAAKLNLKAGEAMGFTTVWDFDDTKDRKRAEDYINEERPLLLLGSPMCTAFSQLQRLNGRGAHSAEKMKNAIGHMEFVIELYKMQIDGGKLFLLERPATASSWQLNCVKKLGNIDGVDVAVADLCMFGLRTMGANAGGVVKEVFAKKPTIS